VLHDRVPRFPAFFASILRERSLCFAILGAGVMLVGANLLHLRVWVCVFNEVTGLPCPGCGMTRAVSALCRGEWQKSQALHPFAPGIALAVVVLILATVLPMTTRRRLTDAVAFIEQRTGITLLFIITMMLWGIWRMLHHTH
jgi:Protein of unknown function (DUF2752)